MNYKIIPTTDPAPDVLLHRTSDADGNEIVRIMVIGTVDGVEDSMILEDIIFEDNFTPILFIRDFSKESAKLWCAQNGITF